MNLDRMLKDYREYPTPLQIAAKLHMAGWTELDVHKYIWLANKYKRYGISQADTLAIVNYVRDFERNQRKLDNRLTMLANKLDLNISEIKED